MTHPYGAKEAFKLWEINFVGFLLWTHDGNRNIIPAVECATSRPIAQPIKEHSAAAATEILEEIIWSYRKPAEIITNNGDKFRSKEFKAFLKRYGIRHHLECFNHELVQRIQRISAEKGNDKHDWDLYL